MGHDEIRFDIPASATGRLDPPARGRLEAHLAECTACRAAAWTARTLAQAIERDGGDLFEDHPDVEALRPPLHRDLDRHVASCASCSLEVQAWQRRLAAGKPGRRRRSRWRDLGTLAAGLAAGLVLGVLAAPGIREPQERGFAAPTPVSRILLQSAVRGLHGEPELTLGESATEALIDVAFDLPQQIGSTTSVQFEIWDAEGRKVWAATESAASLVTILSRDELVGFLVPTERLADGRHRVEVSIPGFGGPALLVAPFQVRRARAR